MHATCTHQAIAALISWPFLIASEQKRIFLRILVLCVPKVESLTDFFFHSKVGCNTTFE